MKNEIAAIVVVSLVSICAMSAVSVKAQSRYRTNHKYTGYIDPKCVDSGLASPTIIGSFSGEGGVGVVIVKGKAALPNRGDFSSLKNAVDVGYSDHGGDVDVNYTNIDSVWNGGTFSYQVSDTLSLGIYTIGIYVYHCNYTKNGFQGISTPRRIATTTFAVR